MLWDRKLKLIAGLVKGWDGGEADSPSEQAIENCRYIIAVLMDGGVTTSMVSASPQGGVVLSIVSSLETVYLECHNDGECCLFLGADIEILDSEQSVKESVQKIKNYFLS